MKNKKIYDHFLKTFVDPLKNDLVEGVIYCKGANLIFGFFSRSFLNCTVMEKGVQYTAINRSIFNDTSGFLSCDDGVVRRKSDMCITDYYGTCDRDFKYSLDYSVSSNNIVKKNNTLSYFDISVDKKVETFHSALGGLSIGVEIETCDGQLPKDLLYQSNLIPLRDGSIAGLEYVTTPMYTAVDLQRFFNSVNDLKSYTNVNSSCALHFHFGNVPRTESFINALWILVSLLQNEIYQMYHPYKMLNWGYKNKAYSKPLDIGVLACMSHSNSVSENFELIYDHLSEVESYMSVNRSLDNVKSHPKDPTNEHKWNIKNRYSIVNFVPLIFINKKTVEFRISEPTLDINEIALEMLLFSRIINYAINNESVLNSFKFNRSKLNLHSVIKGLYSDNLSYYIYSKIENVNNDYVNGLHYSKYKNKLSEIVYTTDTFKIKNRAALCEEKKYNITSWLKDDYLDDSDDDWTSEDDD